MPVNLKSLIRTDADMSVRTSNIEWKDKMVFTLRFLSRTVIREILDASQIWQYDSETKKRAQTLDTDKFIRSLSRRMVSGWSGITLRKLSKLMPLKLEDVNPDELDAEIQFDFDNLQMVLSNCVGLDEFLQNCSQDITLFQTLNEEALRGNSSSSPTTT